jgi:hypothetical protein
MWNYIMNSWSNKSKNRLQKRSALDLKVSVLW